MKTRIPQRIIRNFPKVTEVRDATKSIVVTVDKIDAEGGKSKNPEECALARACIRKKIADGAIIGIGTTWLIKGTVATRYKTSTGVAREITSYDRHHDFQPGKDYVLGKVSPTNRFGHRPGRKSGKSGKEPTIHRHKTINIRRLK
jgi:hypothetical protein